MLDNNIPIINYSTHPAYKILPKSLVSRFKSLKCFLPFLYSTIKESVKWESSYIKGRKFRRNVKKNNSKNITEFQKNGIIVFKLLKDKINDLNDNLRPYIEKWENHKKSKGKRIFQDCSVPVKDKNTKLKVNEILKQLGILETASLYNGMDMKLHKIFFIRFDEDDVSHWKKNVDHEMAEKIGETKYMHIDSQYKGTKVLIYLNEVTSENGPFCYIPGSQKFNKNRLNLIVRKTNDKSRLDGIGLNRRLLFRSLPEFFQKKASFGFDLERNSIEEGILLKNEQKYYSKDGNVILFDFNGIHRGGMIKVGHRDILQILLTPRC